MERPVIEQEGCIAHGQRHQRDGHRRSAQLFGDAARRDQQQHQPVHRQDPAVAEQQLADSPQQGRAYLLEIRLCQRIVPQQEHKGEGHFLVRHEEQTQQAHRAIGRQSHGLPTLHADCGDEEAGHRRSDKHRNGKHSPQQHQGHAERCGHAAVGHGPAFTFVFLHGSSHCTGWLSASSGSMAWRRPRIMMLSSRVRFSLTSSIP